VMIFVIHSVDSWTVVIVMRNVSPITNVRQLKAVKSVCRVVRTDQLGAEMVHAIQESIVMEITRCVITVKAVTVMLNVKVDIAVMEFVREAVKPLHPPHPQLQHPPHPLQQPLPPHPPKPVTTTHHVQPV